MTMTYESEAAEALADELEQLISDTIDFDWKPRWAADAVLPLLREAHRDRDRYQREAAWWREEAERLAEVLAECDTWVIQLDEDAMGFAEVRADSEEETGFLYPIRDELLARIQRALASYTAALIDGGEA